MTEATTILTRAAMGISDRPGGVARCYIWIRAIAAVPMDIAVARG